MQLRKAMVVVTIQLTIMASLSLYGWLELPDGSRTPVHWNMNGNPDRYGGKWEVLFLLPGIALCIAALFLALPHIEPRREHLRQSSGQYAAILCLTLLFLTAIHAMLVATALGYTLPVNSIIMFLVGMLFIGLGWFIRGFKSNYFVGVRTPWTLSSEFSWEKTHALAGKVFPLCGALLILLCWLPPAWATIGMAGIILACVTLLIVYSWHAWKIDPTRKRVNEI